MDINNNYITNEVLSSSNDKHLSLNSTNLPFEQNFAKKNFINYSNSNLSKKINDLSKTMGQTNINALNIYANQNLNKNLNINLTNEMYNSNLKIPTADINLTENNNSYPTEDSILLNTNSITLANVSNANSQSTSNVTSFTTTANPIPIPVNSSSFHISENRNINNFSYINSMETPTTLSVTKINEPLNSSENVNSLSMFYSSDMDFNNNSLNANNNSVINNPIMPYGKPSTTATSIDFKQKEEQHQQPTSIPPQPPSFMTTTIANPLLSHDQAEKISFSTHISSSFNDREINSLLSPNSKFTPNNFTNEHYSAPEMIKHGFDMPVKIKLEDTTTPLLANKSSLDIDTDMNLDMNYNSNINSHSQLTSSVATPTVQPVSTEINNSLDLNTLLSNQISNLHIHSIMDINQETSSSTSTSTNIPTTNESISDLQTSTSSFSDKNQNSSSSSNSNIYYPNVNSNSALHKPSNSLLFRKNLAKSIKKPPQQPFLNYSNKYPLSSSLKLVKKEPGTKINFVKKKISMKSALSSSLDTKLSNIDMNKNYNSNILNTPHYSSNNENNKLISPSFVLTSPDHISKPLNNYELSNQIQQAPVSVTSNNSYPGNNIFVRSNNLTIPNGNIQRNYGYDSKPLSTSLTTKTIQNQHIVHNSLNDDIYTGGSNSNSFPYKYNPPTAFHKGYFSLASQLDILNEKRKKRKESHNATERRRRDFINEKIYELSTIIPESFFEQYIAENKMHKGVILQKSVDYINHLLTSLKTQQEYTSKLEKEINEHSSQK